MPPDRQKIIQSAEKMASRGRIQAAIEEYRKVLDRHPNDTSTLNRVGDLYARLNRMPKAIELFQQTALSFGRQGFFVKAIAIYKKIIRLDPGRIGAYESLADLYNRQGLTGDSLAQYQVVADYYQKHGKLDDAIGVYDNMVAIEPTNPTRRLQLAGLLQSEGQTSRALDQYYEIATLMLQHSRGDDALRVLLEALAVDAGNLDFVRKAKTALRDGGFDRLAEKLLDAAVERNPEANALRLDDPKVEEPAAPPLTEQAGAAPASPAPASQAPAGPAPESPAPAATAPEVAAPATLEPEPTEPEPAEASAEVDEGIEIDLGEIELGDLEELPPVESLDPVMPASVGAEAPATAPGTTGAVEQEPALDDEIIVDLSEIGADSEFTLDDAEAESPVSETADAPAPPEAAAEPAAAEEIELDLDLEEPVETIAAGPDDAPPGAVAPSEAPAVSELETSGESIKLLIEAEVLSRYGMDEMAISVLERILRAEPEHAEAMARLVQHQLRLDRTDEALVVANQLADLVGAAGAPRSWEAVCDSMAQKGFTLLDGRFAPAPGAPVEEPAVESPAAEKPAVEMPEVEIAAPEVVELDPVHEVEVEVEVEDQPEQSLEEIVAEAAAESRPRPSPRLEPSEDVLGEMIEDIERETETSEAVPPPAAAGEPAQADAASPAVLPAELASEEFVDLATELEAELIEDGLEEELLPNLGEQSLEDIVEGFRQGMAETLSDTDFDTHYNLGVAYREMGLVDEAIGEFQLAAKDERYLVECCSLLASCFVEKNFHDLAIQWYARGIESPAVDPESKLGLLYELGTLLVAVGEPEAARERFLEIYGINSNYRDVVAKLEELPA